CVFYFFFFFFFSSRRRHTRLQGDWSSDVCSSDLPALDAIVTVRTDSGECRFALEYERTLKSAKRYRAIVASISQEVHLDRLLYLVANYDILQFVSGFFTKTEFPVFFGLHADWDSHLLEMPVLDGATKHELPLRQALN